jgi:hypothetical protein
MLVSGPAISLASIPIQCSLVTLRALGKGRGDGFALHVPTGGTTRESHKEARVSGTICACVAYKCKHV